MNGMCFWERVLIQAGFRLVHDGQKNPGQFELAPKDVRFYTRKYRWFLDDAPVNCWVTLVYDDRECHDITISYRDGQDKGELFTEVRDEHREAREDGDQSHAQVHP